jgi:hypothetical protein
VRDVGAFRGAGLHLINSLLHVIFVAFLGALLAQRPPSAWLPLAFFAASSKLFALILEGLAEGGGGARARLALGGSLAASFVGLLGLGGPSFLLGAAILVLYASYPRPLGLGEKPVADLVHHATRYCLLFLLGYGIGAPLVPPALFALMAIFASSVAGEIFYRLRKGGTHGTVGLLGLRAASALGIAFLGVTLVLGYLFLNAFFTFTVGLGGLQLSVYDIAIPALALYLTSPLLGELLRQQRPLRALRRLSRRELMTAVLLGLISLYLYAQAGAVAVGREDGSDFILDLRLRVLVAGSHPWDVPWIWFRFRDYCNSYYLLLQTNGVLELGKIMGCQKSILAALKTDLTPFSEHEYVIAARGSHIEVYVDGRAYFDVQDASISSGRTLIGLPGREGRSYPMILSGLRYQPLP